MLIILIRLGNSAFLQMKFCEYKRLVVENYFILLPRNFDGEVAQLVRASRLQIGKVGGAIRRID
jgi:hypothetical protein